MTYATGIGENRAQGPKQQHPTETGINLTMGQVHLLDLGRGEVQRFLISGLTNHNIGMFGLGHAIMQIGTGAKRQHYICIGAEKLNRIGPSLLLKEMYVPLCIRMFRWT